MRGMEPDLTSAAYALFALDQPLTLEEIAEGARSGTFPAAAPHTPEWFAAAADSDDLLSMAPELRVLPPDAAGDVDVSGVDLIRVYAPEMARGSDAASPAVQDGDGGAHPHREPRESLRLSLLQELGGLDD